MNLRLVGWPRYTAGDSLPRRPLRTGLIKRPRTPSTPKQTGPGLFGPIDGYLQNARAV
jgi:hypothetical protein